MNISVWKILTATILAAVLAGCKAEIEIPVYTTDIESVGAGGGPLDVEAQLVLPIPNLQKCDEYKSVVGEVFSGKFRKFVTQGCERRDFDSVMLVKVSSSLISFSGGEFDTSLLADGFGVAVSPKTGPDAKQGRYILWIGQKFDQMSELIKDAEKRFGSRLDSVEIKLVVNNDSSGVRTILTCDSFVDGDPVAGCREYDIERRSSVTIELSNVSVASIRRGTTLGLLDVYSK